MTDTAALVKARQLLALRRPEQALEVLSPAVAADPDNAQLQVAIAQVLFRCGHPASAIKCAQRGAELAPDDVSVLVVAVEVLRMAGDPDGAKVLAEHAQQLSPDSNRVRFEYALACSAAGDNDHALQASADLVATAPDWVSAHAARSIVLRKAGHPRQAETAVRRALELDPESSDLRNQLALLEASVGKLGSASRTLSNTLGADPRHVAARSNVAVLAQMIVIWLFTAAFFSSIAQLIAETVPDSRPFLLILAAAAAAVGWRWWRQIAAPIRAQVRQLATHTPGVRRGIWVGLACVVLGTAAVAAQMFILVLVVWGLALGFPAGRFWLRRVKGTAL